MRLDLPKAKVAEEKPAVKGRAKKLEGTEDEDVTAAPVDSLVEIVHEENKGPFAPSSQMESSESASLTARAHPFFAEEDEEEVEQFEEVGELIEDGCVVEPGDDDDERNGENGEHGEELLNEADLNVDSGESAENFESGDEPALSSGETAQSEDNIESGNETP
jgi:hypothetical protein